MFYAQKIDDIDFNCNKSTKQVYIDYKILDSESNFYNVNFKPYYSNGIPINVNSYNADLINIKGPHSIIWEPKDGIEIEGNIYILMTLKKENKCFNFKTFI